MDNKCIECEELKNAIMQKCPQCGEVYLNPIGCELYEQFDQLKAELQKYKDMEAKGLEEFKNIGGCWGCGIQSSLDEVIKEFQQYKASKQASYEALQKKCNELELENRKLKAENEELKKEIYKLNSTIDFIKVTEQDAINRYNRFKQALKNIAEGRIGKCCCPEEYAMEVLNESN